MKQLLVGSNTQIQKLAGAIAANIRNGEDVSISIVGASALNQAIKACIVCRRFLSLDEEKSDIVIQPKFELTKYAEPSSEDKEITTIVLTIKKCQYDEKNAA